MTAHWETSLCFLLAANAAGAPQQAAEKTLNLEEVQQFIQQNRTVIIEKLNQEMASENLKARQKQRLPELTLDGTGYFLNQTPLDHDAGSTNDWRYQFDISSEFDLYTGGMHTYAIERQKKELDISKYRQQNTESQVQLQAYILLYDIHRNMEYRKFIASSIRLREKEYERIEQLYKNGLVLKSDLLRSKLYITDLQKDEIAIKNSIDILSGQLCVLLAMKENYTIRPQLETDLNYQLTESFDELFQHALNHSPHLKIHRSVREREEATLKETRSAQRPRLSVYARYGAGSPSPAQNYHHRLGGEIGAKVSLSLSAFYKKKHSLKAQQQKMQQAEWKLNEEEEQLRNALFELYTRYHESLVNIDRALEKINMSKESTRILNNSYFNQQALLIDVLESETQSMEASFEWVEAIVNSQKYYWSLRQICGYL